MDPTTKIVLEVFGGTLILAAIFVVYVWLRKKYPTFPFGLPSKETPKPIVPEPLPPVYDPHQRPPKPQELP